MKKIFLLMIVLLCGKKARSQITMSITNNISCDVDITVTSVDINCNVINSWGPINVLPNGLHATIEPSMKAVDFQVRLVIDPSGGGITFPLLSPNGICGGATSHNDPTACSASNVDAIITPTGTIPDWILDITP